MTATKHFLSCILAAYEGRLMYRALHQTDNDYHKVTFMEYPAPDCGFFFVFTAMYGLGYDDGRPITQKSFLMALRERPEKFVVSE